MGHPAYTPYPQKRPLVRKARTAGKEVAGSSTLPKTLRPPYDDRLVIKRSVNGLSSHICSPTVRSADYQSAISRFGIGTSRRYRGFPRQNENGWNVCCRTMRCAFFLVCCGFLPVLGQGSFGQLMASNLRWEQGAGYRKAALPVPKQGRTGFTLLSPTNTGITFTNVLTDDKVAENQIRLNGSGVACGDVDEDGWCDLYFCGLENGNKLYRNLGGWKFEDVTDSAGVACADQYSTGAVFADVNGDGHLDLLVNGVGRGTRLFLNDGKGHFHEVSGGGLVHKYAATTMALADVDGDGYLDLYVANYRTTTIRTTGLPLLKRGSQLGVRPEDKEDYELTPQGLIVEHGEPHFLYLNDGHGNFQLVSWTNGAFLDEDGRQLDKAPKDWGLTAAFRDLNGDRAPDLYVCNDFMAPDRIWMNDGHGRFRTIPRLALRNTSTFSMAVDFADINRDGFDDLFEADMLDRSHQMRIVEFETTEPSPTGAAGVSYRPQVNRNTLQLNRGDGTYAEIAYYSGLESSGWTWSCIFLDVDLDGYEDLLMSTGYQFDTQDLDASRRIDALGPMGKNLKFKILMYPRLRLPRIAFRNLGNLEFEECGARWGFNDMGVAHGMALADLDNDGDLDVVMNSLNEAARIYRNETIAPRVAVRLKGAPPNTRGIGAKILVRGGAVPLQSQEMMCGGRYLSGDDNMRVFAAGSKTNQMRIEVLWRSGKNSALTNVAANWIYEIDEAAATALPPAPAPPQPAPFFEDVSQLLAHSHHEELFDDFQRQPLLPNRLSQLGPGVAWGDLDGDGWEDLIIGTGKGGVLAAYRNNGNGGFTPIAGPPFGRVEPRDQTAVLVWPGTNRQAVVLAGSANYEDGAAPLSSPSPIRWERAGERANVLAYDPGSGKVEELADGAEWSVGPVVLGDIHGDGNLDLFVGGRVIPGHYPEAASSRLYRNEGGRFVLDTENSRVLERVGLVSGAVMTDLDGDGFCELVLACEWGPIRVFKNDHGRLREVTAEWGLDKYVGWWNGVTAGDLDGDGRMDLIASNWGLNTKYRAGEQHPRKIYYGDFQQNGQITTIETYFDKGLGKEVPEREFDAVAAAMPFLRGVFSSHHTYGAAGISDVLGEHLKQAKQVSANTLASMIFLNRGKRFVTKPLPPEAQLAPAFAVVVADFDGDGAEDIFLSQDFFATEPQTSRADAGRGLWLKGDGQGGLGAVAGQESGVLVYGEQRGAAACDFDGDGRVDLVVTQNGAQTRLFRNTRARPGLRVRLAGPAGNPRGIGAVLRLRFGDRYGPAREIHGGSGYWSQDSAVPVLGTPTEPTQIWVRWPGGHITTADLAPAVREVEVNLQGNVRQIR